VGLHQTRTAVADQQCFEDAVAPHRGEVISEQKWRPRRVYLAVERDDHARVACHGPEV
jgi:hypothetical protein